MPLRILRLRSLAALSFWIATACVAVGLAVAVLLLRDPAREAAGEPVGA